MANRKPLIKVQKTIFIGEDRRGSRAPRKTETPENQQKRHFFGRREQAFRPIKKNDFPPQHRSFIRMAAQHLRETAVLRVKKMAKRNEISQHEQVQRLLWKGKGILRAHIPLQMENQPTQYVELRYQLVDGKITWASTRRKRPTKERRNPDGKETIIIES